MGRPSGNRAPGPIGAFNCVEADHVVDQLCTMGLAVRRAAHLLAAVYRQRGGGVSARERRERRLWIRLLKRLGYRAKKDPGWMYRYNGSWFV